MDGKIECLHSHNSQGKIHWISKKLLQKVFQLIYQENEVLFNILKVYRNLSPGNMFFQDNWCSTDWIPNVFLVNFDGKI